MSKTRGIKSASKHTRPSKKRHGDATFKDARRPKPRQRLAITAGTRGVEYRSRRQARQSAQSQAVSELAHQRRISAIVGIANTVDS